MTNFTLRVKNGIVDIRDGSFTHKQDHSPMIEVVWKGIDYPTEYIDKFMLDIMSDNSRSADFLQKLIGSLFTNKPNKNIVFYGKGHDGKELLAGLLDILSGDYYKFINISVTDKRPLINEDIVVPFYNRYINPDRAVFKEHNDRIKNPYILDELLEHMDELLVWVVRGSIRYNKEGLNDIPHDFVNNIHNQQTSINLNTVDYAYDKIYHTDNERIVVPENVFLNRLNNDVGRLFLYFNWENVVLAGEYVLGCLDKVALHREYLNAPIDLYVYEKDQASLHQRISETLDFFRIKLRDVTYQVFKDTYLITIKSPDFNRDINIIGVLYDNVQDLLYNIDLTCYQVGFNGKELVHTDYFVDSLRSRVAISLPETSDIYDVIRVIRRGFAFKKSLRPINCNILYNFHIDRGMYDIRYASGFTKVNITSFFNDIKDNVYRFTAYDTTSSYELSLSSIVSEYIRNREDKDLKGQHGDYVLEFDKYYGLMEYLNFTTDIKQDTLRLRF